MVVADDNCGVAPVCRVRVCLGFQTARERLAFQKKLRRFELRETT